MTPTYCCRYSLALSFLHCLPLPTSRSKPQCASSICFSAPSSWFWSFAKRRRSRIRKSSQRSEETTHLMPQWVMHVVNGGANLWARGCVTVERDVAQLSRRKSSLSTHQPCLPSSAADSGRCWSFSFVAASERPFCPLLHLVARLLCYFLTERKDNFLRGNESCELLMVGLIFARGVAWPLDQMLLNLADGTILCQQYTSAESVVRRWQRQMLILFFCRGLGADFLSIIAPFREAFLFLERKDYFLRGKCFTKICSKAGWHLFSPCVVCLSSDLDAGRR